MIRNLFCVLVVMTVAVGFVAADEFIVQITKVDGNKITYERYRKGKKDNDPVTIEVAMDAKIADGKFDKEAKKLVAGDPVEGGLKNKYFSNAPLDKGIGAQITTSDDNKKVTQILLLRGGKKKDAQ
jgi:hypothetical protein